MRRANYGLALGLATLWALGACTHYAPRPEAATTRKVALSYKLGPNDIVAVGSVGDKDLQFRGPIGPSGEVGLPLVGIVNLGGKTLPQARKLLAAEYAKYLRDASITLTVIEFSAHNVHVMGEVRKPGSYPLKAALQTTAVSAIQEAGSFDPVTADIDDIRVIRGALAKPQVFRVDMEGLLDGDDDESSLDLLLQPGDIVYVPPKWVTSMDRAVRQFLSPLTAITGAAGPAALGVGFGTGALTTGN